MKKFAFALLTLCLVFMLAACDGAEPPPATLEAPPATDIEAPAGEYEDDEPEGEEYGEPEETPPVGAQMDESALGLSIALATDELLALADSLSSMSYHRVVEARDGAVDTTIGGDTLVIQAAVPLYEFAVVLIGNDVLGDDIIFIPIETFGMVESLMPGAAFVIEDYQAVGTFPWSGITFLDGNGHRWYFAIIQDQSGEMDPYRLLHFEDRRDELPADWVAPW